MFPFLSGTLGRRLWLLELACGVVIDAQGDRIFNAQRGVGRADDSLASPPEDSLVPVGCHVSCQPPSFDLMTHCSVNPSLEAIKRSSKRGRVVVSSVAPDDNLAFPPSAGRASSIPAAQTVSAQNAARLGGLLPERCAAAPVFSNVEHARLPLFTVNVMPSPQPVVAPAACSVKSVLQEKRWVCFGLGA